MKDIDKMAKKQILKIKVQLKRINDIINIDVWLLLIYSVLLEAVLIVVDDFKLVEVVVIRVLIVVVEGQILLKIPLIQIL